jgi:hypothetical protein
VWAAAAVVVVAVVMGGGGCGFVQKLERVTRFQASRLVRDWLELALAGLGLIMLYVPSIHSASSVVSEKSSASGTE